MINMHTTDMMTLATGDVETATKQLHSTTAVVSFQSIVAADDPATEPQADGAEVLLQNDAAQENPDFFASKILFYNNISDLKDTDLPEGETVFPAKTDLIDDETSLPTLPLVTIQNDEIIRPSPQGQETPEMGLNVKDILTEGVILEGETEPQMAVRTATDAPAIGKLVSQESPLQMLGRQRNATSPTYNQASNSQTNTFVEPQTDSGLSILSTPMKQSDLAAQYTRQLDTAVTNQEMPQTLQPKGEIADSAYDTSLSRTAALVEGKGQTATDKVTTTDSATQQKSQRTEQPLSTMTGAGFPQNTSATPTDSTTPQIEQPAGLQTAATPTQVMMPTSVPLQSNELIQKPSLRQTLTASHPQETDQLVEIDQPVKTPAANAESQANTIQNSTPAQATPLVQNTEISQNLAVDSSAGPDLVPLESQSIDGSTATRQDANLNRPEVMRHVAQQMASVARQSPDRPVELILNPEELGRVRLTFTTTDAGINVAVMAERGETTELLRRHIETLAQEFRELGYKDVSFDFSGNGAGGDQTSTNEETTDQNNTTNQDASPADIAAPVQLSLTPSTGLDLRL